jgi:hypothetical protein
MDADAPLTNGAKRTAKSCGPDAATLASSFAEVSARRWWQQSPFTREITKETVKTIRVRERRVPVHFAVTNSCAFYPLRTRLRGASRTGAPHAL